MTEHSEQLTKPNPFSTYDKIKQLMGLARQQAAYQLNAILVRNYWEIGRVIVEDEQSHAERADYGASLLKDLSKRLSREFGRGFSRSNLQNMRNLYLLYPKCQTLSGKLTWSHYCELLAISDDGKRAFYERESENASWSVRELKRQIATSLYERLLLSSGQANKEKLLQLALQGNELQTAADLIKDPYVFGFLGLPEDKALLESDLESALLKHIEKFLLELGKGFMFVGSQQRVSLGNTHYYVDLVFYNKILRSYVLIELKSAKLMPEAIGQINMYLNYYRNEINDEFDQEPIGIILCTDKDSVQAEYALGGLSNKIFASKYTLYIPERRRLEAEVQRVMERYEAYNHAGGAKQ